MRATTLCGVVFVFLAGWIAVRPASAALLINEIMYDPAAVPDSHGEWFEIYNSGASAVALDGYKIGDAGATKTLSPGLVLGAGGYMVFGRDPDPATNGGVSVADTFSFSLGNSGDTVRLLDPSDQVVQSVTYGPGTGFPSGTGSSIAYTGAGDPADGANWIAAADLGVTYGAGDFGTPGAANAAAVPEPGSVLLLGSGAAWLAVRRRT